MGPPLSNRLHSMNISLNIEILQATHQVDELIALQLVQYSAQMETDK